MESGWLRIVFWVARDEAYRISQWIITSYPGSILTRDEDNFNFFFSSLQMRIEQAVGMLVARWILIRDGLKFSVKRCRNRSTVIRNGENWGVHGVVKRPQGCRETSDGCHK